MRTRRKSEKRGADITCLMVYAGQGLQLFLVTMSSLAFALPLLLAVAVNIVNGNLCEGKSEGLYPNSKDPNKFIHCAWGVEHHKACQVGLVFDTTNNFCNWPSATSKPPTQGPGETNAPTHTDAAQETNTSNKPNEPHTDAPPLPKGAKCARVVCYFTNWAQYRSMEGTKHLPTDIDPNLCTHVIYAFATLKGNKLDAFEWNDESTDWSVGNYVKATNLKQQNPNLKVSIAVGGWNLGSAPFSAMVTSASSRQEFVSTTIQFLRKHKFDGLDLDWEYPANRGSPPDEKQKFTLLVQELRAAFNKEASGNNRLLLTAAVAAGKKHIDTAYDIPAISKELDFINLMTYDFHGGWETVTGHNSPLYASTQDTDDNVYLNTDWAANYWVQQGAPKNKIVVGMALYARSFTLTSSANGLGAPASIGSSGTYTRETGYLSYYEVCELQAKGGSQHFLNDQKVPYLVSGNQWVGFDDASSLREKVRYVRDNGFGGAMVWSLDLDDFKGGFCGKGRYPLLSAINDECSK